MTTDIEKLAQQMREAATRVELIAPSPWIVGWNGGAICCTGRVGPGDQAKLFDVRGWGYLTGGGHGALGLSRDEGAKAQDDIAQFVAMASTPQNVLALLDDRERLVAEVAAAKATMEMAATSGAFWARRAENAEAAREAKERECERLREALREIAEARGRCAICGAKADRGYVTCDEDRRCTWTLMNAQEIAAAALATSGGGNG